MAIGETVLELALRQHKLPAPDLQVSTLARCLLQPAHHFASGSPEQSFRWTVTSTLPRRPYGPFPLYRRYLDGVSLFNKRLTGHGDW